jgi:hypothetical protein
VADIPRFPVRFDEETFTEDLQHATGAGRDLAERERARLERDGIATDRLMACQAEGETGPNWPDA